MTHDYKRNGTTTLFAALNVLEGNVIGRCMQRHTHQDFIRFLNTIEKEVPANKQVHVVLDNYATHKHPKVVEWLGRYDRFTFHFTPTSASWINAVEGFFAKLTDRRLKRGVFHSIVALQAAINRFVKEALRSRAGIVAAIEGKSKRGRCSLHRWPGVLCRGRRARGRRASAHRPAQEGLLTKAKGQTPRRPGALGLGHVNAHHQRLKQFINLQARGVSTRYLPDYLGWSRAVRRPGFAPINLIADPLIHKEV